MTADAVLGLLSELMKLALVLCLPLLAVILVVSLLVSILQVVTQVQDASIAFVPKLVVFIVALALLGPWMLDRLVSFGTAAFGRIAG